MRCPLEPRCTKLRKREFDGNVLPNLGFDDRMLGSVVLVGQVDVQLVGRVR